MAEVGGIAVDVDADDLSDLEMDKEMIAAANQLIGMCTEWGYLGYIPEVENNRAILEARVREQEESRGSA